MHNSGNRILVTFRGIRGEGLAGWTCRHWLAYVLATFLHGFLHGHPTLDIVAFAVLLAIWEIYIFGTLLISLTDFFIAEPRVAFPRDAA